MNGGYTFSELCRILGKSTIVVRRLQRDLKLPVIKEAEGYSEGYLMFMERVVALRAFSVPVDKIAEVLETEKKILKLLHFDSLACTGKVQTWYLPERAGGDGSENQLLLTDWDVGFPITDGAIQRNLDFGEREAELFKGPEMGEDVAYVLDKYLSLIGEVEARIRKERSVLRNALDWAQTVFAASGRRSGARGKEQAHAQD